MPAVGARILTWTRERYCLRCSCMRVLITQMGLVSKHTCAQRTIEPLRRTSCGMVAWACCENQESDHCSRKELFQTNMDLQQQLRLHDKLKAQLNSSEHP